MAHPSAFIKRGTHFIEESNFLQRKHLSIFKRFRNVLQLERNK